jgi:hypothetical protein
MIIEFAGGLNVFDVPVAVFAPHALEAGVEASIANATGYAEKTRR